MNLCFRSNSRSSTSSNDSYKSNDDNDSDEDYSRDGLYLENIYLFYNFVNKTFFNFKNQDRTMTVMMSFRKKRKTRVNHLKYKIEIIIR